MEHQFPMPRGCFSTECHKAFSKPVKLTVMAEGSFETYRACSYCFSPASEKSSERSRIPSQPKEIQVEPVTLEVLREIDILSDAEGKYVYHLASMYVGT